MFHVARYLSFALCCVVAALFVAGSAGAVDDREGVLVGRVSHVEGKLLRYVEEENDWVLTVKDAPFGLEDALYAGEDAKAEFVMPSGAWMRVGANTQLQLIDMSMGATTLDVASGMARFYNKSRDGVIKVTTPFGYAVAPAGSAFDLYVGDESMEVIAVRGAVDFVHDASGSRYQVREGGDSIIADRQSTAQGNGAVDGDWDDWNNFRESVWAKREQSRSRMADLLPEPIREESYTLEDNGRWERVQYEGAYRDMWRPTRVDPGWRPFTAGRWTQYYGDNCWIPDEPFGYVTHHYGSWVYVDAFRAWYWMPPVVRRRPNTPTIFISFGWYPGRVGWIHGHDTVGWVPLGPNEIYYGHRPWGHRTKVVNHTTVNIVNININKYRYLNEAVVVNRDQLYRGNRYTPHLRRDFDRGEIVKSFKPMPVVASFENDKRRFAYNDAQVGRKPHAMAAERINSNQSLSKGAGRINRDRIEKDLNRVKTSAEPPPQKDMRPPTLGGRLVEAGKTTAPIDRTAEPAREIKSRDRERRITPDNRAGSDRQGRRSGDAVESKHDVTNPNPDESRRLRPSREGADASRNGAEVGPAGVEPQGGREAGAVEQVRDASNQGDQGRDRRIRSPRDREAQGPATDRSPANRDRRRSMDERQSPAEQGAEQGKNLESNTRQEQAAGRRGQEEMQRRQQAEEQEKQQELQRRRQEDQGRRQEQESQLRQESEAKQRQEEVQQRRQQEDQGRRQQEEVQQRRQQIEEQGKQQELQRRRQEDQGRRQEQEQQRRQEMEAKQRQEESAQRQRQEEVQQRRQQEAQQRQQQEEQGRRQEQQRRQELEAKQRQEEMQQRRQQEAQQRQQEEAQQRQQQEVQQRRQAEEQGRRQEMQRRQQDDQSRRQEQQQQEQRKKKKLTPEEELLQRQSGSNQ